MPIFIIHTCYPPARAANQQAIAHQRIAANQQAIANQRIIANHQAISNQRIVASRASASALVARFSEKAEAEPVATPM